MRCCRCRRKAVGPGVQPQPWKPRRAHAVGLQRGRRKEDFAPAKSGPLGPVTQGERRSAPHAESGRAPWGTTAVQAETLGWAIGTAERRSERGVPARWPRRARSAGGGAVLRGDTGVQPGEVACRPSDHRAAVPPFSTVEGISFDRLLHGDGLRAGRTGRVEGPTPLQASLRMRGALPIRPRLGTVIHGCD